MQDISRDVILYDTFTENMRSHYMRSFLGLSSYDKVCVLKNMSYREIAHLIRCIKKESASQRVDDAIIGLHFIRSCLVRWQCNPMACSLDILLAVDILLEDTQHGIDELSARLIQMYESKIDEVKDV